MHRVLIATATFAGLLWGTAAQAQDVEGVMSAIRAGGGWVAVPITAGEGSISSPPLPTFGLTLAGCVRVWDGHSGSWEIRALETVAPDSLSGTAVPGEGVRFSHTFGLRAQMEFEFRWSERRDTTLFLWVGMDRSDDEARDACTPVYSGGGPALRLIRLTEQPQVKTATEYAADDRRHPEDPELGQRPPAHE